MIYRCRWSRGKYVEFVCVVLGAAEAMITFDFQPTLARPLAAVEEWVSHLNNVASPARVEKAPLAAAKLEVEVKANKVANIKLFLIYYKT